MRKVVDGKHLGAAGKSTFFLWTWPSLDLDIREPRSEIERQKTMGVFILYRLIVFFASSGCALT